ncbi:hypothetical protein ACFOSC_01050 [Streptantibioticus rubrisoli]|uniref:Uncharacterized protein n=1 Tax=Streptantibioticus rubrisoli TaxID=1387313 RepID=A0ABT1PD35_9ACTN|nr:hypothetical protein [Streptantibioticus rubrisoli]MCQ4043287.1 hypothetical protein [Streptantibioticus rubrisoli]
MLRPLPVVGDGISISYEDGAWAKHCIRASLRDACDDLMKQRPLFTDYGRMLLDELCCFAETVEFDHVAETISSPEYAGYRPTVAA